MLAQQQPIAEPLSDAVSPQVERQGQVTVAQPEALVSVDGEAPDQAEAPGHAETPAHAEAPAERPTLGPSWTNVPTVVIIYGNPGRGKSTLTNYLGKSLGNVKIIGGDGLYVSMTHCNHRHILSHIENELASGNTALFEKIGSKISSLVRHNMNKDYIILEGYLFSKIWPTLAQRLSKTCLVLAVEKTGLDTLQHGDTVYHFNKTKDLDAAYNKPYLKKLIHVIQKKHIAERKLAEKFVVSPSGGCQRNDEMVE